MASEFLSALRSRVGYYVGNGINHENQLFTGEMVIREAGTGFSSWFRATGAGADVYHEEIVLIAPNFLGGVTLASVNSNVPALQLFKSESAGANGAAFITDDFENEAVFRERVTLTFGKDDALTYAFAWGMPMQKVEPQSAATMRLVMEKPPTGCPLAV